MSDNMTDLPTMK